MINSVGVYVCVVYIYTQVSWSCQAKHWCPNTILWNESKLFCVSDQPELNPIESVHSTSRIAFGQSLPGPRVYTWWFVYLVDMWFHLDRNLFILNLIFINVLTIYRKSFNSRLKLPDKAKRDSARIHQKSGKSMRSLNHILHLWLIEFF